VARTGTVARSKPEEPLVSAPARFRYSLSRVEVDAVLGNTAVRGHVDPFIEGLMLAG